jgi:uncharacterized protein
MPVRLLTSSVLKWPSRSDVLEALERWAQGVMHADRNVLAIGYFGSYARSVHGVGSDLDIVIIIKEARSPFVRRAAEWDTSSLPVATDVIAYTEDEWKALDPTNRFHSMLKNETRWIKSQPPA